MVGGRPGEEGLLRREGCGESHVSTSSEWAAWLGASEIRNFKTDKLGLEDGPGPHPHVSFRIQTLRSTETPSWHFSILWPAPGATPAPSAWVSAWGQAQLRWPPSYESFQKLLTWCDWAPTQQNTCTACDAQGPPGSPSFCGPISPGWQVKKPAPTPAAAALWIPPLCQRDFFNLEYLQGCSYEWKEDRWGMLEVSRGRTIEIPSLPLFFRPPWEEDAVMQEFSSSFSLISNASDRSFSGLLLSLPNL